MIIWVAHDRLQRRGDGKSYLVILKQDFYHMCSRASLG